MTGGGSAVNGEFNYKPTWVISSNPRLDALDALEQLYRRLILPSRMV